MLDKTFVATVGLFIGFLAGAVVTALNPAEHIQTALEQYRNGVELVKKCEEVLPRNQQCELVISAVPKGGDV